MRPPSNRALDRRVSRACIDGDRVRLARALRAARGISRDLYRECRSWACWIGWPMNRATDCATCGGAGHPHGGPECPECGA